MIESIEIKNFRCFKDTKIAKFGLVNLFGGLNNSGKTALLEAIYLAADPNFTSILFLHITLRKEVFAFIKERPQNAWDNLFFQQDKEQKIIISSINNKSEYYQLDLKCSEEIDNSISINEISAELEEASIKSILHLDSYKNGNKDYFNTLSAGKSGFSKNDSSFRLTSANVHFIPASIVLSGVDLARGYDKARFESKGEMFLEALQLIDIHIERVDVFSIGKPTLYLKRKNEKKMPISLFGDAINKIADIVLRIINNPCSIVLIDEIENGIHYTNQEKLWKILFDLAIEYNVQVFSTTHSYEMAKAFVNTIKKNAFDEKAGYFELARHVKTGNIIASPIPVDILEYDIENNFPFRGE